ncbi:DeoR family transcriptional regulator [Candidatus Giovannonibacteria bacterium]|nr:DeoR family transcriptional regulator [Candidatus Giovannonibacteria bacterium]
MAHVILLEMTSAKDSNLNLRLKKLTSALYRVTDLLLDREPLKWMLRERALEILTKALTLRIESPREHDQFSNFLENSSNEFFAALELASEGGFISGFNFELLKSEYLKTLEILHASEGSQKLELFEETKTLETQSAVSIGQVAIGHAIGQNSGTDVAKTENNLPTPYEYEEKQYNLDKHTFISQEKIKEKDFGMEEIPESSDSYRDIQARKDTIVEFLKQKEWASIGELVSVFRSSLSEKTLQRDLASLVEAGRLEKQGEKRWRRYAIKSPYPESEGDKRDSNHI